MTITPNAPAEVRARECDAELWSPVISAARPPESVLVLGGGSGGAIASSLTDGIMSFARTSNGTSFRTASRSARAAWPGSSGHLANIDRNDAAAVRRALLNSSVIIDAAGAHMADALQVKTIAEARARGAEQARVMTSHLNAHPNAALIFISSQYANPALKDPIGPEKTFEVIGFEQPVSVRLYAELKAGYEDALLAYRSTHPSAKIIILRLGTLLSESYRAKSAEALVAADGRISGKSFTPDEVLSESLASVLGSVHRREHLPPVFEISSRDGFNGPRSLGVVPESLDTYVRRLKDAWN